MAVMLELLCQCDTKSLSKKEIQDNGCRYYTKCYAPKGCAQVPNSGLEHIDYMMYMIHPVDLLKDKGFWAPVLAANSALVSLLPVIRLALCDEGLGVLALPFPSTMLQYELQCPSSVTCLKHVSDPVQPVAAMVVLSRSMSRWLRHRGMLWEDPNGLYEISKGLH